MNNWIKSTTLSKIEEQIRDYIKGKLDFTLMDIMSGFSRRGEIHSWTINQKENDLQVAIQMTKNDKCMTRLLFLIDHPDIGPLLL